MNKLIFFSRKHCGICQDALFNLEKITKSIPVKIIVKDIDLKENRNFKLKYHLDVPVIHYKQYAYKHPFDFKEILLEIQNDS